MNIVKIREKIKHYIIKDTDEELINKILQLKGLIKKNFCNMLQDNFQPIDMIFMGSITKLFDLIDNMIFSIQNSNVTVCAILSRVAMDCSLRTYASTLVQNADIFSQELLQGKEIGKMKSKSDDRMTDKFLCEELGKILDLPIYEKYQMVCDYVHLSSRAFLDKADVGDNFMISFSFGDYPDKEKEIHRKKVNELGHLFYFFSMVLVDWQLGSWIYQKKCESKKDG